MNDIKRLVETTKILVEDSKFVFEGMNEIKEWGSIDDISRNIGKLSELAGRVAICVEQAVEATGEVFSSREKRKVAVKIIDDMIKLPGVLELVDGPIIEGLLTIVVETLNRKFGHVWTKTA